MTDCLTCKALETREGILVEDQHVAALLSPEPMAPGHVVVVPKKHSPILEAVPDVIARRMIVVANRISIAVFEALGAQGTNILIQNGLPAGQTRPHVQISVLPRRDGDNLQLDWKPGGVSEDESGKAEIYLKQAAQSIGVFEKEPAVPLEERKPESVGVSEDDMRVKQLRRIP